MTHCTMIPAPVRQLAAELAQLTPDVTLREEAGLWFAELPYSADLLATLASRGHDALRCGPTIRVA